MVVGPHFLLPVIIGSFLYAFHTHFHFKTTNHGVLVSPPLAVWGPTHQWQVIYLTPDLKKPLDAARIALGRNAKRVMVKRATTTERKRISGAVQYPDAGVYLVDPLGNVFMVYLNPVNPMDVLKDVMHVLQVSQIG